jgi:hypothetical protein
MRIFAEDRWGAVTVIEYDLHFRRKSADVREGIQSVADDWVRGDEKVEEKSNTYYTSGGMEKRRERNGFVNGDESRTSKVEGRKV